MTTIHDAFLLPSASELTALGFVVKLSDADPSGGARARARIDRLVDDYVITPTVETALPFILHEILATMGRNADCGRFLHGDFGSGKSHFMSYLGLLLEGDDSAWRKDHPVIRSLAGELRPALEAHPLLVVRIHMLSARTRTSGLDHVIYEGFNAALQARGKAPCVFVDTTSVIAEARREAELYGAAFWKNLAQAEVVDGPGSFEELAGGDAEEREGLAKAYLKFKGRDAGPVEKGFAVGMARLARHAKEQGFQGVVLLVDELILWLAEKSGREFAHEINNMNLIVDHDQGKRAVPVYVLLARQRNIKDSFPDDTSEDKIFEHLAHHRERFEPTELQTVELRHVVRTRVLRRRAEHAAAVEAAAGDALRRHEKALPELMGKKTDPDYLRDVFPFHPALIEMLVDVSTLLQRERSALRLLYELLCVYYPTLRLGDLMPVGSAFDAIFPPGGIDGGRRLAQLRAVHQAYYRRLLPAIQDVKQTHTAEKCQRIQRPQSTLGCAGCPQTACFRLNQLVKTVLLAEVSPSLKTATGLSVQRLVRLNEADVEGDTDRGRVAAAEADLQALNRVVPALQVTGRGKTATVTYVLQGVNLGEILDGARNEVSIPRRFSAFYGLFRPMLGLSSVKGFRREDPESRGTTKVEWRGTERPVQVRVDNVRQLVQADFARPEETQALILIDYPWDEEGHSVDEDRQKALGARKSLGSQPTLCWLPRHFAPAELQQLTELGALDLILEKDGNNRFLEGKSADDRASAVEQARLRRTNVEAAVRDSIDRVYRADGQVVSLTPEVDDARPDTDLGDNLKRLARAVLDRRFPAHPVFTIPVKKPAVAALAKWLVKADGSGQAVEFDDELEAVLDGLGIPLELVQKGTNRAQVRTDGRFLKRVLSLTDNNEVVWSGERGVAATLQTEWGVPDLILDLFLDHLARARGYRLFDAGSGQAVEPGEVGGTKPKQLVLRRGKLLELAAWSEVRELGQRLFNAGAETTRTLANQDALATALRTKALEIRQALTGLHAQLVSHLVDAGPAAPRVGAIKEGLGRLAVFSKPASTDSHEVLTAFRSAWTGKVEDAAASVVKQVKGLTSAVDGLRETALRNLERARGRSSRRAEIEALLGDLRALLAGTSPGRDLTEAAIRSWNQAAEELIGKILDEDAPPVPPVGGRDDDDSPQPPPPPKGKGEPPLVTTQVVLEQEVDLGDARKVEELVAALRSRLETLGRRRGSIRVTFGPESGRRP